MEKNVNKPITVVRAEFISSLSNLINGSMLPPFIIESILKDAYLEINAIAQKQLELDVQKYQQEIKSDDSKDKDSIEE